MKRILLGASLVFGLLACSDNNNDQASATKTDSSDHTAHSTPDNQLENQNYMKSMHDAMNTMMTQMQSMKPSGDPDHDFAMMMKHHHLGAIDMAKSEIAGGSDATLKQKAQKMIDDQQSEIAVFDKMLQGMPSGSSDFGQKAMGMMTPMSEIKMESSSLDAMFASMMIPHHQDAVKMAQEYLKVGKNEELKTVAQNIVTSQQKEIQELQEWLDTHKR